MLKLFNRRQKVKIVERLPEPCTVLHYPWRVCMRHDKVVSVRIVDARGVVVCEMVAGSMQDALNIVDLCNKDAQAESREPLAV